MHSVYRQCAEIVFLCDRIPPNLCFHEILKANRISIAPIKYTFVLFCAAALALWDLRVTAIFTSAWSIVRDTYIESGTHFKVNHDDVNVFIVHLSHRTHRWSVHPFPFAFPLRSSPFFIKELHSFNLAFQQSCFCILRSLIRLSR